MNNELEELRAENAMLRRVLDQESATPAELLNRITELNASLVAIREKLLSWRRADALAIIDGILGPPDIQPW